jgi:CBS domain-containing protein
VAYSPAMPPVSDHMSRDLLIVDSGLTLAEVAGRMVEREVGAVLVLEGERLAGILTERDMLRAVARGIRDQSLVRDHMTTDPDTIGPGDSTEHAATLMMHGGYRHLPVTDAGAVIGIVSIRDLMRIALEDSAPRGV